MDEPWLIDEVTYAGPEHLDARFAARFDDKQGHPDPSKDLAELIDHGVDAGSTVLDFGAGTGQFAIPAANEFARVVAIDVSPAMLEVMRQRAVDLGLHNLECVPAGFLTYKHAGPPADAVYTRNALHHLPDFWKALALWRIGEVLRPRGILLLHDLIYDFQPAEAGEVFARWFDRAAVDPAHGYSQEDFTEHIRTENSTFRWLFEPMLQATGFDVLRAHYDGSVYGAYLCIKR